MKASVRGDKNPRIIYIYIRFQIPEDIRQTEGKLAETISRKRSIGNSDNGIKKHK